MKATALKSKLLLISTFVLTICMFFATIGTLFGYESLQQISRIDLFYLCMRIILSVSVFGFVTPHIIIFLEEKISSSYDWKRLAVEFLSILLIATIIGFSAYHLFPLRDELAHGPPIHPVARGVIFNMVFGAIMFAVQEVIFNMNKNYTLEVSLATLEKEQMGLKLNALQQRLDPHFMFNSLNVLSELVHEDSEKAERFINQFSKVYRYVLELNQTSLVTVEKELEFLDSYEYLLEIRMGESLQINRTNNEIWKDFLIPPLSLQLLLENAIKHNAASNDKPLHIELYYELDMIVMKNNKRLRTSTTSSGFGLLKLMDTYKLLGAREPIITENDDNFIVSLPLIKSES